MIETQGIVKRFGRVTAVDRATFTVPDRTVCGFLGPNGAGKTTTIRMIVGVLAPDEGRLQLNGLDPAVDGPRVRAQLGYLAEESPIHPELSVEEFVMHRACMYGVARAARRVAVDSAVKRCQLEGVRRRLCGQLSKGYRQRCGLAAAIVHNPSVLVLDEPTSGFDPSQVLEFRRLVRELAEERTVLLSSHVLAEVEAVCDRAVLIDRGRVAAEGTLKELRERGASAATLVVEADRDVSASVRELTAAAGSKSIDARKLSDGWWRTQASVPREDPALAQAVAASIVKSGAALRLLEWAPTSLESVFHRVVAAAGAAAAPGVARAPGATAPGDAK